MIKGEIPRRLLKTSVNVYQTITTKNSVGETVRGRTLRYTNLMTDRHPQTSDVEYSLSGVTHRQTHIYFLNKHGLEGNEIKIEPNDVIGDNDTGKRFLVLGIREFNHFRDDTKAFIELAVKFTDDSRYFKYTRANITCKARISG